MTITAVLSAILYVRVSTDEQADSGYSLRQQLEALRAWCKLEGYKILEEVEDPGHSGAYLERPGLDRVRDLVEDGGVAVVVAQDADRITRDPIHRGFLDTEFERFGTRLIALDDWGDDTHEGELLKYMKGWVSKGERLKTAERMRRGLNRKVAEGKVIRGNQAPYGFAYDEHGEALVVSEPEMRVVRRIYRWVAAEGLSLGEVQRRLNGERLPSPTGGKWNRSTVRNLLLAELHRPLSVEEVAASGLVSQEVVRTLDEERIYALWCWNRKKVTRWRERGEDGEYRNRVQNTARPREEWSAVAVDITEAELSRDLVDAAREQLASNERRPPSTRAMRFWQLSGGMLRCAECGNGFAVHTVHQGGKIRPYYRCYTRYNSGLDACTNRRNLRAPELEEAVWEAVLALLSNPHRLLRQYEEHMERQRRQMRGDPDREAQSIVEQLQKLERRRSGYLDLAADGDMDREILRAKLAEVNERSDGLQKALREAQARQDALRQPEINYAHLNSLLLQMNEIDLGITPMESRPKLYKALQLKAHVDADGQVRLSGVFDPDVYMPDLLREANDSISHTAWADGWLAPRPKVPEGTRVVVSMTNAHPYTL